MKYWFLCLLLLLCSTSALSATYDEIVEAFKNDPLVQIEINKVKNDINADYHVIEMVDTKSSCGDGGCFFSDAGNKKDGKRVRSPLTSAPSRQPLRCRAFLAKRKMEQISPDKNVNCRYTTAAFTASPESVDFVMWYPEGGHKC